MLKADVSCRPARTVASPTDVARDVLATLPEFYVTTEYLSPAS